MTDSFIDGLVDDLKPKAPLRNVGLWLHCGTCLLLIVGIILAAMGLRTDYSVAIRTGSMIWKPSIFLLAWIGSLLLAADISRPNGKIRTWHYVPFLLAAGVFIWQISMQVAALPADVLMQSLFEPSAGNCLSVIMAGGAVAMAMAWVFWFSKTASPKPALLGALAGFSAGCLAATAYALHCNKDITVYIAAYYGTPIVVLSLIGFFVGKKRLTW